MLISPKNVIDEKSLRIIFYIRILIKKYTMNQYYAEP